MAYCPSVTIYYSFEVNMRHVVIVWYNARCNTFTAAVDGFYYNCLFFLNLIIFVLYTA